MKDANTDLQLSARLREAREYLGLSQEEVARHLAIPRSALSNIETGNRRVQALELKKLAQLYKRPVSYFTGEERVAAPLPEDLSFLARAAAELSDHDRQELRRFTEYLRSRSHTGEDPDD